MSKKDEKNNLIIDFKDIKSNKIKDNLKFNIKKTKSSKSVHSKEETIEQAKEKISKARANGLKEMREFRKASEEYIAKIEDLCLFRSIAHIVSNEFIEAIVDNLLEPTLKGIKPNGMPDYIFKEMRSDIYKGLIQHYEGDG